MREQKNDGCATVVFFAIGTALLAILLFLPYEGIHPIWDLLKWLGE